ncbi:hypothetical protein AB0D49_18710 [Streptomyces sp. NPDC048290]|uniref:hypothetical protein n=1 Tax=Streptomyces sp. NPDC048290 TaxID=3155811 RepID=UPI00341D6D60
MRAYAAAEAAGLTVLVPATLWNLAAILAQGTAIVLAVRARRRDPADEGWNPFGPRFPLAVAAAIAGFTTATLLTGRFSLGAAAFGVLWPAAAGVAAAEVAARRMPPWPRWPGPLFAAAGALLFGLALSTGED